MYFQWVVVGAQRLFVVIKSFSRKIMCKSTFKDFFKKGETAHVDQTKDPRGCHARFVSIQNTSHLRAAVLSRFFV
jgi:hypothetical protein